MGLPGNGGGIRRILFGSLFMLLAWNLQSIELHEGNMFIPY